LWIESSSALSVLHTALELAAEYQSPETPPPDGEAPAYPEWSDKAAALLKKGEIAGIPYLSSSMLKSWKGDFSPESLAALVVRSLDHMERPGGHKAPAGEIAAWTANTADTGGLLLYADQFAAIVGSAAGISTQEAAAMKLAMPRPESGSVTWRERFAEGCLESGLRDEEAGALWDALAAAAPGLVSRAAAGAWAGVAMRLASVKASHPAAFLAAAIAVAWEREGPAGVRPLVEEARRLGVALLAPDAARSLAGPVPQRQGEGWAILWGLMLPGWDRHVAQRFLEARERTQALATPEDLARVCLDAGLSAGQVEALVHSGACDRLGERETLLARGSGPASEAGASPTTLDPRRRHLRREWEERYLGAGFTDATEIEALKRAIADSGRLRSRLVSSTGLGPSTVGNSIYLVGLLHGIRLVEDPAGPPGSGQSMAVAVVQDLDGEIELVAFPPNYKRHRELWVEDNMVIVTARVSKHTGGDGIYLLCEHMAAYHAGVEEEELDIKVKAARRGATVPLPAPQPQPGSGGSRQDHPIPQQPATQPYQASPNGQSQVRTAAQASSPPGEPPTYHLIITVPASNDDHADIDRMIALEKLLKGHTGPDTVTLRIQYSPETGDVTSARLPHRVRYDASLEEDIRGLLGPDALALIKLLG
jgi:DNA polymerase III alpha subunit